VSILLFIFSSFKYFFCYFPLQSINTYFFFRILLLPVQSPAMWYA
jgi:hypothetical protein